MAAEDLDLFTFADGKPDAHDLAPFDASILQIDHALLPPTETTHGEPEEGEDLLTDVTASAPLARANGLFPFEYGEDEYFDWPADSGTPDLNDEATLREIDPHGDFAALFAPPADTPPPRGRRRRKP